MGIVGGGPGSFIGPVHRMAAQLDGEVELVAGAFSQDAAKSSKPASPTASATTASTRQRVVSRRLMRCMAVDYEHCGIRVNAVVPGSTETSLMWNNVSPADIAQKRQ
jgi:NAD(P)-dependent dehydrogenase (short-subunit alcohol dehydrogenase family)